MPVRDWLRFETLSGKPVHSGDWTVTPESQALVVRWPNGGFVWNRPVAVRVEGPGQSERVPIVDVTRIALWALAGATVLVIMIVGGILQKERK